MELKIGMKAPDFNLPDSQGNDVSLSTFKSRNIILYFYPKDNTTGCTVEAVNFRDNYKQITESNTIVLGISKDSVKSHLNFAQKYNLPF
ncbi:MAG: peroxiredoxin [Atribacterota bacterium]|jgi:peroxiredoxin Q/BCP|nr:peroxiredoxin [Atribacterota bacterium]MDD4895553.1 peroxiredoxin [Atribacterota bacterium]MDD5636498.1 peroxiredoxin [Atribacterota bacterium]